MHGRSSRLRNPRPDPASAVSDFTMLISRDGAIQMLAASDWPLDRLLEERGARAAYRVGEVNGRVKVEARTARETCRLEAESPRLSLAGCLDCRQPAAVSSAPPRAGTSPLLPAAWD